MKLYNWQFAPNSRRIRLFILEKGLPMPRIVEVGTPEFKLTPEFIAEWSPALVPVLELDDGTRFGEALGIARYLEDLNPEPNLLGATPKERAIVHMWERRAYDEGLMGTAEHIRNALSVFEGRALPGVVEPVPQIPELVERGRARVLRYYKRFERQLRENAYVAGDRFTMADITTLCATDFAIFGGIPIPDDCPQIMRWHAEVSARPASAQSL
ncbi:MAG: glutathione S-transferase family protein [Hyphomicrobium sp.]